MKDAHKETHRIKATIDSSEMANLVELVDLENELLRKQGEMTRVTRTGVFGELAVEGVRRRLRQIKKLAA